MSLATKYTLANGQSAEEVIGSLLFIIKNFDKAVIIEDESASTLVRELMLLTFDSALAACYCDLFNVSPIEALSMCSDSEGQRDDLPMFNKDIRCLSCHALGVSDRITQTDNIAIDELRQIGLFLKYNTTCLCARMSYVGMTKEDCCKCTVEEMMDEVAGCGQLSSLDNVPVEPNTTGSQLSLYSDGPAERRYLVFPKSLAEKNSMPKFF